MLINTWNSRSTKQLIDKLYSKRIKNGYVQLHSPTVRIKEHLASVEHQSKCESSRIDFYIRPGGGVLASVHILFVLFF